MPAQLSDLVSLVPPPIRPLDVGAAPDWAGVEQRLGFVLPPSYKALISTYGSGAFGMFLNLRNPISDNDYLNLVTSSGPALRVLRYWRDEGDVPYKVFPDESGIFPWLGTSNGDAAYWRVVDGHAAFPVIWSDGKLWRWTECGEDCVDCLYRVLSGIARIPFFPDDILSVPPRFFPCNDAASSERARAEFQEAIRLREEQEDRELFGDR